MFDSPTTESMVDPTKLDDSPDVLTDQDDSFANCLALEEQYDQSSESYEVNYEPTSPVLAETKLPLDIKLKLCSIGEVSRSLGDSKEVKPKGFSFDSQNREERLEALKKFNSPVDYKELLKNAKRVALFGETHPVDEVRDELISHMKEFKELGFTDLALEALPSTRQGLIDDYLKGKAEREDVRKALQEDWGWSPDSYLQLIDAAKENGLNVLCLDVKIPKEKRDEWHKKGDFLKDSRVREAHWNKLLGKRLGEDPQARILTLAGMGHTGVDSTRKATLTSLLDEGGYKPTVINFHSTQSAFFDTLFEDAVKEAKLIDKRFMIPVYSDNSFRPSDHIVHLPGKPGGPMFNPNGFKFLDKESLFKPEEDVPLQYRFHIPSEQKR